MSVSSGVAVFEFSVRDSLQDVSVERLLAVAQELSNHLPTQALPL